MEFNFVILKDEKVINLSDQASQEMIEKQKRKNYNSTQKPSFAK